MLDKIILIGFLVCTPTLVWAQENFDSQEETDNDTNYDDYAKDVSIENSIDLIGSWQEDFIKEYGIENHTPEWALTLQFADNGQFFYNASLIEEVHFVNKIGEKVTRPISQDFVLKGTYELKDDKLYLDFITHSAADIETLSRSLGVDLKSREVVITLRQQKKFLVLQGAESPIQIFLTKSE